MMSISCRCLILAIALTMPAVSLAELSETDEEIQHLITHIGNSECRFVRNGKDYAADKAREHIQMKYDHARSRIKSAEDFIRYVGTKSSMSGRPYGIRCGDRTVPCGDWLFEELEAFRHNRRPGPEGTVDRSPPHGDGSSGAGPFIFPPSHD